jgi:hypothetical protein
MTIKLWQLGVVAVALLALATFAGYSLAAKPVVADSSALVQQLAQKDALIASLRTQIVTTQQQQAPASVPNTAAQRPTSNRASKGRAAKSAVLANVRAVLPAVESYDVDNIPGLRVPQHDPDFATSTTDSGYAGETAAGLRLLYDKALPRTVWVSPTDAGFPQGVTGVTPSATSYCVVAKTGDWYGWKLGLSGMIRASQSSAAVCRS